jgi:hypothetical protein
VLGKQRDATGRVIYEWDRPAAFGKVVGQRKVLGDAACLMGRADLEALGFHPFAKDAEGSHIPGGGYFCAVKERKGKAAPTAPMLVRTNGVLGWDQPGLFGEVPEEMLTLEAEAGRIKLPAKTVKPTEVPTEEPKRMGRPPKVD